MLSSYRFLQGLQGLLGHCLQSLEKPQVNALRTGSKGPKGLIFLVITVPACVHTRARTQVLHIHSPTHVQFITSKLGPFSPSSGEPMGVDLREHRGTQETQVRPLPVPPPLGPSIRQRTATPTPLPGQESFCRCRSLMGGGSACPFVRGGAS